MPIMIRAAWLPWAWLALLFISNFKFVQRDTAAAASGEATPQILVELLVYGVVGALACETWIRLGRRSPRSAGLRLLAGYGILGLVSSVWSIVPLFSLVRGGQATILAFLAVVTGEVWQSRIRDQIQDWNLIWTGFLVVLTVVASSGLIWPNPYQGRFSWQGVHTTVAAQYLALGIIVGVSRILYPTGYAHARTLQWMLPPAVLLFSILLVLTSTRSVLASLFLACAIMVVTHSAKRRSSAKPMLAGLVFMLLVSGGIYYWADGLEAYLLRGQSAADIMSFSGRAPLWSLSLDLLADSPIVGFGYGSSRIVLIEAFPWSGGAHNLWLEVALSLGTIGVLLVTGLLLWSLARGRRLLRVAPKSASSMALALISMTIVIGIAGESIALPGVLLSSLGLTVAMITSFQRPAPDIRRRRIPALTRQH